MKQIQCMVLTLVLAFGAVALASHSTGHDSMGAEQCLICTSQADLKDVALNREQAPAAFSGPVPEPFSPQAARLHGSTEFKPAPRGPPVQS